MMPIDKSDLPSNYYRVNSKKKININTKIMRLIVRYLIPTLIVASVIMISDLFIYSKSEYDTPHDMFVLSLVLLGVGFIAVVLCNLWFILISKNQDT